MKKFLFLVLFLAMAVVLFAGEWKNVEKFNEYKALRSQIVADANGTTGNIDTYLQMAGLADTYASPTIVAWQLNNAGLELIKIYISTGVAGTEIGNKLLFTAASLFKKTAALNAPAVSTTLNRNIKFIITALNILPTKDKTAQEVLFDLATERAKKVK